MTMENDSSLVPHGQGAHVDAPIYTPRTVTVQRARSRGELDLERALRILHKNWRYAAVFALTLLSVVTIVTFRMKDIYEPTARLEIDPPGSEVLSMKDLLNAGMNDQDYLETQARILQSDELAVSVIRTLRLDQNVELVGKQALEDEGGQAGDESPSGTQLTPVENRALRNFQQRFKVLKVRSSRLVEVSFASHDPQLAAQVTNTLVSLFIDRNYRTRYETTMQASEWLSGQLSDLGQKVEKSNQALVDYQRKYGIVDLEEDRQNTVTQKLTDLNHQRVLVETERIELEAALKMVESGSADLLPQVHNNQFLQTLTYRFVEARAQLAQALAIYGKNNPNVKRIQNDVDEMEVQLTAERQRVIGILKTSYETARHRESLLAEAMDKMKGILANMNERMVQYAVLKNEARANQELYRNLLAKLKEAGVSAGLRSSNIRVVDQARVLDKPTRPNRPVNIAFGLLAGILGGVLFAFLVEKLDNTVSTPEDVTECSGLASLALFPLRGSANGAGRLSPWRKQAAKLLGNGSIIGPPSSTPRFFLERPHSAEAEAVQNLYTSIMLSRPGKPPRAILVVSASPSEGKTTVSVNLATVLARHGRTCLTETDLRRPAVAPVFGLTRQHGLSNVLTGSAPLETAMAPVPDVPNLMLLLAGPTPPNPAELIASEPMRELLLSLREQFDYVVLDSPPIIPFADARSLSPLVDGVVVVGRAGWTTRQAIMRTTEILEAAHAHVLGIVINGVDLTSSEYRYYHYGRYYDYGYSDRYGYESEDRKGEEDEEEEGLL